MNVQEIPLHLITLPPSLHRKALDAAALERLANSIRDVGLMNPITVEREGDHYVLRAGHRRLEATRLLRHDTIAANVREPGDVAHAEVLTWTENLEREDLSPIEQAEACKRMVEHGHLTPGAVARLLRRSQDWVEERLDLLAIPPALQGLVHEKELPMRHAIELARVSDDAHREHLTRYALLSGASFSVIRDWVSQWRLHAENPSAQAAPLPPLPGPGERAIVLIPCLTCGEAIPPYELRVAHICHGCHSAVMEATEEWRRPMKAHGGLAGNGPSASAAGEHEADAMTPGTRQPPGTT